MMKKQVIYNLQGYPGLPMPVSQLLPWLYRPWKLAEERPRATTSFPLQRKKNGLAQPVP
ncbi:hypothetical protein PMIT1342_00061 [Prochlorococcus marinus str. MIT 1342]|uniref:hypothetical protein n=1 Tax=Prochlorococcus TaxID=1218 RepID=UPI0007BB93AA|nr:hypothetical protein [Prochlorococcus marinus]KZR84345.1 hypothetical protein PMIT1342_00061 [Prochlorococcus marinus str. MIT 1342]